MALSVSWNRQDAKNAKVFLGALPRSHEEGKKH